MIDRFCLNNQKMIFFFFFHFLYSITTNFEYIGYLCKFRNCERNRILFDLKIVELTNNFANCFVKKKLLLFHSNFFFYTFPLNLFKSASDSYFKFLLIFFVISSFCVQRSIFFPCISIEVVLLNFSTFLLS